MSTRAPVAGLPRVNTPVLLALPGLDHDLPSRVEDVRDDLVVVAAVDVPGPAGRRLGTEILTLAWTTPPRGLLSVTCELVHVERSRPPLWVLRPMGELRRLQRRRYARADVSGAVTFFPRRPPPAGEDGWSTAGRLADLSEGGARVLLDVGQRLHVGTGERLRVVLSLSGTTLETEALLVGLEPRGGGRHQARVEFDLSERDGERVRRAVMQRQVEARSMEERS